MEQQYLKSLIENILDKEEKVYMTNEEILECSIIQEALLREIDNPDFIVKKENGILNIYIVHSSSDIKQLEEKYKATEFYADTSIITSYNYRSELLEHDLVDANGIDAVSANFHSFFAMFYSSQPFGRKQLKQVMKLHFRGISSSIRQDNTKFKATLKKYADCSLSRTG